MLQLKASTKSRVCWQLKQQADYPGTHWRHTTTVHEATATTTVIAAAIDVVAVPMNATAINAAIVTVDSTNTLSIARCSTAERPAVAADLHTA